jgi:hypothetical protein
MQYSLILLGSQLLRDDVKFSAKKNGGQGRAFSLSERSTRASTGIDLFAGSLLIKLAMMHVPFLS